MMGNRVHLVVSVMSSRGQPEWVESVFENWAKDAEQLLIFVGGNFNHSDSRVHGLPVVPLPSSGGEGGSSMLLGTLRYLLHHRLLNNTWFLLAQDDSYVRLHKLENFLFGLDPSVPQYLGRWAKGRASEVDKLGLKPHERYCLGSSGIVLNSALLHKLKSWLSECNLGEGFPGDVALGKCISRNLDIQCSLDDTVSL